MPTITSCEAAQSSWLARKTNGSQHDRPQDCGFDHGEGVQWQEWPGDMGEEAAFPEPLMEYDPEWWGEATEGDDSHNSLAVPVSTGPGANKPEAGAA